jgi:ethylbenzene dioxygenase beta subunit
MSTAKDTVDGKPVDLATAYEIEIFLKREARLLDGERYDDWLAMLADDIHYWMPAIESRRRANNGGATYLPGRMALFDDYLEHLQKRVARFKQPTAWAEDPPTRHVHVISNIEALHGDADDEYIVYSTFVNYRSRVEHDNDLLIGRRHDVLRRTPAGLRLARRRVVMTQTVLQAKNINTFL